MVAFLPTTVTPPVAIAATTSTNSSSFHDLDAFMQSLFVVAVEHRNGLLRQYRPGVRAGIHQVHRTACDLHTVGQRVGHSMRTGEGRQQRRMSIESTSIESRKKLWPKDFHKPSGDDQVGLSAPRWRR